MLRTHTSAHQTHFIAQGCPAFLCSGDVYRRDEIDASHYPIFHQMEGVRMFSDQDLVLMIHRCINHHKLNNRALLEDDAEVLQQIFREFETHGEQGVVGRLTPGMRKVLVKIDLRELLYGLSSHLFGEQISKRWREDYFPFTVPSFELDIQFHRESGGSGGPETGAGKPATAQDLEEEKWLEVLGCGIIHDEVIQVSRSRAGGGVQVRDCGWAFGLGLERLAMVLFAIPDIRLFW